MGWFIAVVGILAFFNIIGKVSKSNIEHEDIVSMVLGVCLFILVLVLSYFIK